MYCSSHFSLLFPVFQAPYCTDPALTWLIFFFFFFLIGSLHTYWYTLEQEYINITLCMCKYIYILINTKTFIRKNTCSCVHISIGCDLVSPALLHKKLYSISYLLFLKHLSDFLFHQSQWVSFTYHVNVSIAPIQSILKVNKITQAGLCYVTLKIRFGKIFSLYHVMWHQ